MIDISFEINGRKVNPKKVGDVLEQATLDSVRKQIIRKVGSIRNPKTGERPKIKITGKNLDNLSIEVSGSQELVDLVKKKMR